MLKSPYTAGAGGALIGIGGVMVGRGVSNILHGGAMVGEALRDLSDVQLELGLQ